MSYKAALTVNGAIYEVACAPHEEPRVRALARRLDDRVAEIAEAVGQIGDARLFLLAALTLEDERDAAANHAARLVGEIETMKLSIPLAPNAAEARDARLAKALISAAERIKVLAERIDAA
jgi:cell division protein ZapA